jgi:hypothetical protein
MTRTMNARVAGFTFLFYIVAGLTCMFLSRRASDGTDPASRLEAISRHPTEMVHGPITRLVYLPMLAFEVPVGFLLLVKGVR